MAGPHEWAEPITAGTRCVHCGVSPLRHSDLEPCPSHGSDTHISWASERWFTMLTEAPETAVEQAVADFDEERIARAWLN